MKKIKLFLGLFSMLTFLLMYGCKKDEPSITPSVLTSGIASNITGNTATVAGGISVVGSQGISDYGIVFGTSTSPTTSDSKMSLGALTTPKDFTVDLSGLNQNTDYSFRTYAVNSGGTIYGTVASFKTLELKAPTATTGVSSAITINGFSIDGKITDIGTASVTEFGHCMSATNQMPTIADTKTTMGASATVKDFKSVFAALLAGTSYFVRSYATNAVGTSYGDKVEVKTLPLVAPTVTTGVSSLVLAASATMAGSVKTVGTDNITQYGHVWSSTNITPTVADSKTTLGALTTAKDYTSSLAGLTAGTTYNVRSYATNSVGTAYGDVVTFKTISAELPTVITYTTNSILSTSAKIEGQIGKSGTTAVTQYGHVWSSINQTPTIADSKTTLTAAGTYPLNYTSEMTGLAANSTYYVRAYATSASGTAYSTTVGIFKTSDAGSELTVIKGVVLTGKTGNKYTDLDQNILLNLTTGKTYKFSDGVANSTDVDLILSLYSNKDKVGTGYEDVIFYSPAGLLLYDKFWGDIGIVLDAQNWSVYKGTKLDYFSATNYPPDTWWGKLNSVSDLNTIIAKEYISNGSSLKIVDSRGNINDDRLYVFKTKEGKNGIFRITNANKKTDTYTVTIDIKVQK